MAYRETAQIKARKAELRQSILDAARLCMLDGGFGTTQMADVAVRAGVATGTLYRYFPNKSDLFAEVFRSNSQREVDAFAEAAAVGETCAERVSNAVRTFARRALKGRRMAYALIAEPIDPQVDEARLVYRRAYADVVADLVEEGITAGEFVAQDVSLTAAGLVGALAESLVGPLSPASGIDEEDSETFIESLVQFILRALGAVNHNVHAGVQSNEGAEIRAERIRPGLS